MAHADTRWAEFPGPQYYNPEKVEAALVSLFGVRDQPSANDAYNRVLFAVGNNHAGTAYPAAVACAPRLAEIVLGTRGIVRATALDALCSLLCFTPEPGFETFQRSDRFVQLKEELASSVKPFEDPLLDLLTDPREPDELRVDALLVLYNVAAPEKLRPMVQGLLQGTLSPALARECQAVLEDLA